MIAGERRKLALGLLGELIEYSEMFRGTIDGASAYPREPIWETLWFNSAAVIVAGSSAMSFAECGLIWGLRPLFAAPGGATPGPYGPAFSPSRAAYAPRACVLAAVSDLWPLAPCPGTGG